MISAGGTKEMHRRNVFAQMQREHANARAASQGTLERPPHLASVTS
jgi:hypothetical protein